MEKSDDTDSCSDDSVHISDTQSLKNVNNDWILLAVSIKQSDPGFLKLSDLIISVRTPKPAIFTNIKRILWNFSIIQNTCTTIM